MKSKNSGDEMILLAENISVLSVNVNRVFEFVTNMENYKKWFPGVLEIRSGNNLPHGKIGKTYIETLKFPEGIRELTIEVKKSVKNEIFKTEGDLQPLLPSMKMLFTDLGDDKCQFQLSYFCRNPDLKENDEFVNAIKQDLNERIGSAIKNLKSITVI